VWVKPKVTIRPKFFGTVPNFEGLSRKKYKVIRDAELSRIPIYVPNLSRFNVKMCCSSSSWSFWRFCLSEMRSLALKTHQIHFRPGLHPGPRWRNLWCSPDLLVGWGRRCPLLIPLSSTRLDLGVVATSKSVPNFYHRFMVTLVKPPWNFLTFFLKRWEFLVQILHAYYTLLCTMDYKFFFNYLQLW